MSSEDSSSPHYSELHLRLALTLSPPPSATTLTVKHFSSMLSSPSATSLPSSSSSSSSPSSVTKRTADSVVATSGHGPSQVVGWPPVGAFRMNSFNNHAKSPATNVFNSVTERSKSNTTEAGKNADNGVDNSIVSAKSKSSWFVKVNMDGLPIGRKVDLSAHNSYESLALTLEEMFDQHTAPVSTKRSNGEERVRAERRSKLLDGSCNFVLTYVDREGDWMLVGDLPWRMFLSSVRRLRIMRTSEANGLSPKCEERNSRHKS